jgi:hypothetical protein
MASNTMTVDERPRNRWSIAVWSGAVLLFLLPGIAMQFTEEVNWDATDFLVFGALLFGTVGTFELAARWTGNTAYRGGAIVALVATFLLVWLSLGVGIIGKDGDPANRMYFGVLGVGILGALLARFQPRGMAWALVATALAQALVAGIALVARLGHPWSGPVEILLLNGVFVALFLGSAGLFHKAARGSAEGATA